MSAVPQSIAPRALPSCVARVVGRIENSRTHDGVRYTLIATPAADQYSRPQMLEVRSRGQLGGKGDEVTVEVKIGGFTKKSFETKDGRTVQPVQLTLDLVEG